MAVTIDGTSGINTPGVVNTAAETIATTLAVTGVTTFAAGTAALPAITTTGDTNTGIFFPAADTIAFATAGTEDMRITSTGDVGIGTSSPARKLQVHESGAGTNAYIQLSNAATGAASTDGFQIIVGTSSETILVQRENADMQFWTNNTERARITSAGVLQINQGDGVYIGGANAETIFRPGVNGAGLHFSTNALLPATNLGAATDNTVNLGSGSHRYATVFAATGSINTSDAREKTSVRALTITEISVAKQFALEIGSYKWLAAIEAKGDAAREHIGLTVQRAIEIMEANGLVPFNYGFICYDEFEDGNRYAFRMDELSLFIARGQQSALQEQQALITALTTRIIALEAS